MLKAFIEENFVDKRLFVVTNREPYAHKRTGSGIKVERPAGGVTSALDNVMRAVGGTWISWGSGSGDKEVVDSRNCIIVPPEVLSYTLKRVWLSQAEADNYYHGYSNQMLWPLCHITLDRVYYRKRFWDDYKKVNQYFANAVIEESDKDSIVWIHDYHLSLLPQMLRERKSSLTIAHFWHIPWPNWDVFRVCPQSKEILEGMLGNDLVGFHIHFFAKNFMDCVKRSLDAEVDYNQAAVTYKGHTTRLNAFPISIDYDKFNSMADSSRTIRMIREIKKKYELKGRYIGIGVDRLEYTKALIKRLQAIDLLFERYKRFRKRFTFIQIAVPTRMKEPYISYRKAVEELVSKINKKYSTGRWKPIIYIDAKVEHKDLAAYYRMADVGIISSIYDGMNLVAKEYIASQVDGNGVLILSELAGAADELEGAILVNPYDIEGFSNTIKDALKMAQDEKYARMSALRAQVKENDIHKWGYDIIHEISTISSIKEMKYCYLPEHIPEIKAKLMNRNLFLLLDYDGTLTPIVESPDKAFLPENIRSLIIKLKDHMAIAVVSGRNLCDVKERVGIEDIIYVGNHGAEIWDGKKIVISQESGVNRNLLQEFLDRLKGSLSHIQGLLIEDKGITASLHFRNAEVGYLGELHTIFNRIVRDYETVFRITYGKKVFEIRPVNAWNKGDAVMWLIKNYMENKFPLCIGDDTTDEDAYRAIKGSGISISIGGNPEADYYLKKQEEIKDFLELLYEGLCK